MTVNGLSYSNGKPVAISFDEHISSIETVDAVNDDLFVGPGLVDLQVNGYGGYDYNELYDDVAALRAITKLLLTKGVTTHFPTVITNSAAKISLLLRQIVRLRTHDELCRSCIGGLHLEGPFISPQDGPRGAHQKEHVRPPNWDLCMQWQDAADGLIKIITLSPEWENAPAFIEQCVDNGMIVSIGHTSATHHQIEDAVKAGATLSTHLGNGMDPLVVRHPNYLWSQLANDNLCPSIIADGFHLPAEVIKVFLKVKGERIFMVSDSVSLAGMPPGDYDNQIGGEVTLTTEGKLHMRNNPSIFAGSASCLKKGMEFLLKSNLVSLSEAWTMASVRPWKIVRSAADSFTHGSPADIVMMRVVENNLSVMKVIKDGKVVHDRSIE